MAELFNAIAVCRVACKLIVILAPGQPFVLGSQLVIGSDSDVTLVGSASARPTLSASSGRIVSVAAGGRLALRHVNLEGSHIPGGAVSVEQGGVEQGGCAMVQGGSTLELNRCQLARCQASSAGGAIFVHVGATLLMSESEIIESHVVSPFSARTHGWGGGVYMQGGMATLNHSNITNCTATGWGAIGGALAMMSGALRTSHTVVRGCIAMGLVSGRGGGMFILDASAAIDEATFESCASRSHVSAWSHSQPARPLRAGGGIYVAGDSNVSVVDSLFSRCSASGPRWAELRGAAIAIGVSGFWSAGVSAARVHIVRTLIEHSTAMGNWVWGASLAIGPGSKVWLRQSRVLNTTAGGYSWGRGIISVIDATLAIEGSLIAGVVLRANRGLWGGAISVSPGAQTLPSILQMHESRIADILLMSPALTAADDWLDSYEATAGGAVYVTGALTSTAISACEVSNVTLIGPRLTGAFVLNGGRAIVNTSSLSDITLNSTDVRPCQRPPCRQMSFHARGAGISVGAATSVIKSTRIANARAIVDDGAGGAGGEGGGLQVTGGDATIEATSIEGNFASGAGGGIFVRNGFVALIDRTILRGNSAGGGVGHTFMAVGGATACAQAESQTRSSTTIAPWAHMLHPVP